MTWADVAQTAFSSMDGGQAGLAVIIAIFCIYGILVGILRTIQRMYIARQVRVGLANANSRQVEKLIEELVEELE